MRFAVRTSSSLDRLKVRMLAAAARDRDGDGDGAGVRVALPATSAIRDPATIASLGRFGERADEG